MATTTIYLSSTYEDLKDYRRVVFEALRKSGYDVIAMEEYVAADQRPVDQCLKDVEKADVYVGLFAFRYGYVPPSEHNNPGGLSITELEFRQAERSGKPCLTFVVSEDALWPPKFIDSLQGGRINQLRDYLRREKTVSFFSTPHELASLVQGAVTKCLVDKKQPESPVGKTPPQPTVTWDIEKNGSPYPGLMNFTTKDAPVFFGRDAEVRAILDRMRSPDGRFIIVSGDSGVGKSSLVFAGVLPKLEANGLPGNESCKWVRMLPSQERQPLSALMAVLSDMATRAGLNPDAILKDLNNCAPETLPDTLTTHIKNIIRKSTGDKGAERHTLLLFVDQMEELFTSQDITQSNQFLTALYHAAQEQALWVVATIRSDHLHYCHRHPEMVKVLRGQGHYPLGRVEPYMMLDMIMKPAQCASLKMPDTFARRLIHDTGADSANLPLLAFVLNQLFEQRMDHELSESVYQNMRGVTGAIEAHVKTVEGKVQAELESKTDEVLPNIFERLVKIQKEEGVPTRNRPLESDFSPSLRKVIKLLVDHHLLRTEGEGDAATVSISHEKLFEAWPSLREYVETHKKMLVDRTLLESRARKWVNMGKPWLSGLASGREYKDFRRAGMTDTGLTRDYLSASLRVYWLLNSVMAAVIVLILGTTWLWQKGYSVEQAILKVQSVFVSIHVPPKMQPVSSGTFRQGDTHGQGLQDERPVHEVTIKRFAIGKFEVTFDEYDRFAIARGRPLPGDQGWDRDRRPVINVSWQEAKDYADWLSRETGKRFRLPTESEWEYAARSEGKDDIWAGTSDKEQLKNYAVYAANSQNRTSPVGENEGRKPNALGLYDMSGNVFEWVEDCVHGNYNEAPMNGTAWLEAAGGNCGGRMLRGGSWNSNPVLLRASHRYRANAGDRNLTIGFRFAQDMDP